MGEFRVDVTRLSWTLWGDQEGEGEEERGEPGVAARKPKVQKRRVTKMSGLYREETLGEGQPSTWAGV